MTQDLRKTNLFQRAAWQEKSRKAGTKPVVLKSLSLPLRSNVHPKLKEKSFAKDDIYEETTESQPSRYEWWKEVEVERMLVEKIGGFRGNGRNKEEESL